MELDCYLNYIYCFSLIQILAAPRQIAIAMAMAKSLSMPYFLVNVSALLGRRTGAGCEFALCIGSGRAQQLLVAATAAASYASGIVAMRWRIYGEKELNDLFW